MSIPIKKMLTFGLLPSFLKIWLLRAQGAKIGKNFRIGLLSCIAADEISIGDDVKIGMLSFINARAINLGNRVSIGMQVALDCPNVSIGHDSQIMEQCIIGGMLTPRSKLLVGSRVKVFPFCFLNTTEPIVIEDDVGVGGSTYMFTHGSWQSALDGFPIGFGPITIKRGVWLPWRVFILPNVIIGEFATIGAGSVINRSLPPRCLAAGIPAKTIKINGEHVATLDQDSRWKMLENYATDFLEFMNFMQQDCYLVSHASMRHSVDVVFNRNSKFSGSTVRFCAEIHDADHLSNIGLVALFNSKIKNTSTEAKHLFLFNIDEKVMTSECNDLKNEVRNFMSRYGVRFSVDGESEWPTNIV